MATIDDVQFPPEIRFGVTGGPEFDTTVLETAEGFEFRNRNWSRARRTWDVAAGVKFQDELDILAAFFRARSGMERGFRFKDWTDFKHDMAASPTRLLLDEPDGTEFIFQLFKTYSDAASTHIRVITRPTAGTIVITTEHDTGGTEFTANTGFDYTIDHSTGLVTWLNSLTDNSATFSVSNPANVLSTGHGLVTGDSVYFQGGSGFTSSPDIVDRRFTITRVNDNNFTIDGVDMTGVGSGMQVRGVIDTNENLYWAGEFDVPVRFNTDVMEATIDSFMTGEGRASHGYSWKRVGLVEVREALGVSANRTAGGLRHPEATTVFHDVRLPEDIEYGASGGPGFKTIIFTGTGGEEARGGNWDQQRAEYEVAEETKELADFLTLQDFFHARWGKAFGFRFKDWSDFRTVMLEEVAGTFITKGRCTFESTAAVVDANATFITDGVTTDDFIKIRPGSNEPGGEEWTDITTVAAEGVLLVPTLDDTIFPGDEFRIYTERPDRAIAFGKSDVPENVQNGSNVTFHLTKAYTSSNSHIRRIRKPIFKTVRFWIDTGGGPTEFTRVTSGLGSGEFLLDDTTGIITLDSGDAPASDDDLTWEGEFDVPVRFTSDMMNFKFENAGIFSWTKIGLVEIRQD